MSDPLRGLISATPTPMRADGSLWLERVEPMVDWLLSRGVAGLYVCGSTGEGVSLTGAERRAVAEAFVSAARGRVPVAVQVGHNSLREARDLAAHAAVAGADVVSATCPSYFRPGDVDSLAACMAEVAAGAPELPFYYYHIPEMTGVDLDMVAFLDAAAERIPNLAGLKYTAPTLHGLQGCLAAGSWDVLWGIDEMLLGAWVTGVRGAVGSTYNVAMPLYTKLLAALEAGGMEEARRLQGESVRLVRLLAARPFGPALKAVLAWLGQDCGPCRLPWRGLGEAERSRLRAELEASGLMEWM